MRERGEARKWARALRSAAGAIGLEQQVGRELALLSETLSRNRDLVDLMWYPGVPLEAKVAAITGRIGDELSGLGKRFISLLVEAGRFVIVGKILEEYEKILAEELGVVKARVTSARPLASPRKERLAAALGARLGKRVEIVEDVDPDVIGGVRIIAEDLVIDGTVSNTLRRFMNLLDAGGRELAGQPGVPAREEEE
ncbi:MAG TPA: ATP synthase F1 subunit delta [Firmicutes bacterium]|nr:ATP synthase F1 subunit delta [Bacillota bacterium]